jgi:uncharacterized membrane protein
MATATTAGPARERLRFLDAVRGWALILMVLNHTGRWWQDAVMRWPRYYLIYVTLTLAAPMFVFLVGFCLPLSASRAGGDERAALGRWAVRGVRIILAGLLLNVLVFPEDPVWNNGVLQTLGFSILVAAPAALLLRSRAGRWGLFGAAVVMYLLFVAAFPRLTAWVAAHPRGSRVLFFEFPPWPWLSLVLVGLVLGSWWVRRTDVAGRARYMWGMAAGGVLCLGWFFGWDVWAHTANRWMFTRDFSLNNHWTPRGAMLAWVFGMIFLQIALAYYLVELRRLPSRWLVILGQTALFLYFTHHLIVLTLINQWLGERFNNWWTFSLANALLVLLLVAMGRGWQEAKRWYRDHGPALGVFGRA